MAADLTQLGDRRQYLDAVAAKRTLTVLVLTQQQRSGNRLMVVLWFEAEERELRALVLL